MDLKLKRRNLMKTLGRSILFMATLAIGANALMAAQSSNVSFEQWYKAKFGRSSPMEERRQKAEQETTAYREQTTGEAAQLTSTWFEQWYRTKYGRSSPLEEKRLIAEQSRTAYREETSREDGQASDTWFEQWYKTKYGRSSPKEEAKGR